MLYPIFTIVWPARGIAAVRPKSGGRANGMTWLTIQNGRSGPNRLDSRRGCAASPNRDHIVGVAKIIRTRIVELVTGLLSYCKFRSIV